MIQKIWDKNQKNSSNVPVQSWIFRLWRTSPSKATPQGSTGKLITRSIGHCYGKGSYSPEWPQLAQLWSFSPFGAGFMVAFSISQKSQITDLPSRSLCIDLSAFGCDRMAFFCAEGGAAWNWNCWKLAGTWCCAEFWCDGTWGCGSVVTGVLTRPFGCSFVTWYVSPGLVLYVMSQSAK